MTKKLYALIAAAVILFGIVAFMKFGNIGTQMLWNASNEGSWLFPLISVAALIDSINPCAFSILLLTIGFLLSLGHARTNILKIGGVYILGIFVIYIMIGLGILQTLQFFNTPHFMAKLGATLIILAGVMSMIGELFPNFPIKLKIPKASHEWMAKLMDKASMPAAFILGVFVGLCEFPCTGGPYLMVLGLLHDKSTYVSGMWYLIYYNLVFVLPLIVILCIASEQSLIEKVRSWKKTENHTMRIWGGIVMVALGVLIFLL
jgi:cytochrome c-type biogenesis protein